MALQWGIIGTGTIARTLAEALTLSDDNILVAVGSRSQASANAFVANCEGSVSACPSYEDLLARPDVDVVYVSTPHPQHAQWAIAALRAGKHVLCEKPMTLNHAHTMAVVAEAERQQRFLMEAFMYRCHPQTLKVRELLDRGVIGEVRHVRANFGYHAPFNAASRLFDADLGGGGILDVGCYPVSMARYVFNAEPLSVAAHGRLGETGIDEWSHALLGFPEGKTAHLGNAVSLNLDNSVTIYGSEGHIHLDTPWNPGTSWSIAVNHNHGESERIEGDDLPLYVHEIQEVKACIDAGLCESPRMSWQDSLANAFVLDAWRSEINLSYPAEHTGAATPPVHGNPLNVSASARMQHAHINGLDKPVSRLVMGCDNQPSASHANVMWDHYFEQGGNTFDTAYVYGQGSMERLLGHWISNRGVRDDIVLIGKGAHTPLCYPEYIHSQLDESLERLQSEFVDIYFLHRDNLELPVSVFIDALNEEVRRGRVRIFGGSNWTLARTIEANEYAKQTNQQGFSAISNNFSLAHMVEQIWPGTECSTDAAFRSYLKENDVALLPWSSQARGFFTPWADQVMAKQDSYRSAVTTMQPTEQELKRTWFSDENFERRRRAGELANRYDTTMINIALAYVLTQPFACFPLVGPRLISETESCLDALDISLSSEEVAWLDLR